MTATGPSPQPFQFTLSSSKQVSLSLSLSLSLYIYIYICIYISLCWYIMLLQGVKGMEGEGEMSAEAYYKGQSKIGSRPPSCENKCYGCTPCEAIQVPTTTNHLGVQYANYEPEGWKCKCGPSFYSPWPSSCSLYKHSYSIFISNDYDIRAELNIWFWWTNMSFGCLLWRIGSLFIMQNLEPHEWIHFLFLISSPPDVHYPSNFNHRRP